MNAPLEELVKTLGLPAALRLVERFGGTRVYLPRPERLTLEHPVVDVVGLEAARELCQLWPQERPWIPLAAKFLRDERDRALIADSATRTMPQLARKYETTERHVYRILLRRGELHSLEAAAPPAQKQLF